MANPHPTAGWKKGQSGNPKGSPGKEHSITQTIKDMMAERPEIKKALGAKILEMAMKGDITAMKTIWQYMDGMPLQQTDVTTDGEPLRIIFGAEPFTNDDSNDTNK